MVECIFSEYRSTFTRHSTPIIQFTEMRMNWTIRSKSDLRIILFPHRLFIQMNYKMKIAIYILHTFSWWIIWRQSGPALSRCEIGLNVLMCIKFVHSNTFHFIFKETKQSPSFASFRVSYMRRVRIHDLSNLVVWMAMLENEWVFHQERKKKRYKNMKFTNASVSPR